MFENPKLWQRLLLLPLLLLLLPLLLLPELLLLQLLLRVLVALLCSLLALVPLTLLAVEALLGDSSWGGGVGSLPEPAALAAPGGGCK
jgi:hypothetical protein